MLFNGFLNKLKILKCHFTELNQCYAHSYNENKDIITIITKDIKGKHEKKKYIVVVVVSVPDYFWSRVSPFFQLSWNSHTPLLSVVGFTPILLGLTCVLTVCIGREL